MRMPRFGVRVERMVELITSTVPPPGRLTHAAQPGSFAQNKNPGVAAITAVWPGRQIGALECDPATR